MKEKHKMKNKRRKSEIRGTRHRAPEPFFSVQRQKNGTSHSKLLIKEKTSLALFPLLSEMRNTRTIFMLIVCCHSLQLGFCIDPLLCSKCGWQFSEKTFLLLIIRSFLSCCSFFRSKDFCSFLLMKVSKTFQVRMTSNYSGITWWPQSWSIEYCVALHPIEMTVMPTHFRMLNANSKFPVVNKWFVKFVAELAFILL